MKVAAIGAGRWGRNIVRNLRDLGALAAVAEPDPATRDSLRADCPGVSFHDDYKSVLDSDVPAVAVATPAPTHYRVVRAALEAGKDVFVEKPITLASAEADELAALARERGRVLMVGHLLLYQPAVQWIRAHLASGALGRVHGLHQERLNLGKARSVENALWSLGVHDVAVLLHLVGEAPSTVRAEGQRVLQPDVEDDVYLHLDFPGGARAHLHCSWLWPEMRRRLTVVAERGMLVYDEKTQAVTLHDKGIGPDLASRDDGERVLFRGEGQPLRLELQHFLDRVADRKTPLSDGASAAEVVRVLERAGAAMGPAA